MTAIEARQLLWLVVYLVQEGYMQEEEKQPEVDSPGRWKCPQCGVWTLHKKNHQCWMEEAGDWPEEAE